MTKACAELLLSDYSRRGFVDGRGARLPSVVVRAGAPNAATTGCFSAVVREPLAGTDVIAPIGAHVKHAVTSSRGAVDALLSLHELPAAEVDAVLGFDRTVFVPSVAVSLNELEQAVRAVVTPESSASLGNVTYEPDDALSAAVGSFPTRVNSRRANALGLSARLDAESIVREYAQDFPAALHPSIRIRADEGDVGDTSDAAKAATATADHSVVLITGGGTGGRAYNCAGHSC